MIPHREDPGLDWTSRVLNEETSRWAVEMAEEILREANEWVPKPPPGTIVTAPPIEVTVDPRAPNGSQNGRE